jgi:hypothetical protein
VPKKVDNRSLEAKISLRMWLLNRMNITDVKVLDTCSGLGMIWSEMEKHVHISQWVKCDIKPRAGGNGMTLKMSASQSLAVMDLSDFNVIDIDTYGEPWEPYRIMLSRLTKPVAVFLTHGRMVLGSDVTNSTKEAMKIPLDWEIPQLPTMVDFVGQRCLEATWKYADIIHSGTIYSAPGQGRAAVSYYALGLSPKPSGTTALHQNLAAV